MIKKIKNKKPLGVSKTFRIQIPIITIELYKNKK